MRGLRIIAVACVGALLAGSVAWAGPGQLDDAARTANGPHRADFLKDSWSSALGTDDDITSEVTWSNASSFEAILTFHGASSNFFLRQDVASASLKDVALYSVMDSGMFDIDFPSLNFRLYGEASDLELDHDLITFTLEDRSRPDLPNWEVPRSNKAAPEPTALALFGGGLVALGALRIRRKKAHLPSQGNTCIT